ncbi:AAA family ATPase [uncultured Campylobacter sp.]|uniref:ATP-binding protein n=1 Tax=uncultured Campylobacter sp. TaxID=218934 RepID=UPI002633D717|nr:AAA family ATPase [uncultured Campylobacter sp.]
MLNLIEQYQERFLKNFNTTYKRYLYNEINFNEKLIGIVGARGTGKTTMLFQKLIELKARNKKALYISLDYPFLGSASLSELAFEFVDNGGEYLLLDEVHKYEDFAAHLKTIYDMSPLNVIFTGSSAVSILNAKSDLSRRVSVFSLEGLSFREFLELENGMTIDKFSLEAILKDHQAIANDLKIKQNQFKKYLKFGYYPFYFNKQNSYYESLLNTINLSIDVDLTSLGLVEQKYTYKLKKLLEVVCQSEPFEVNYTKIAALAEISRAKLYDYIAYLNDARLVNMIDEQSRGLSKLVKPAKIYMNNTNLIYAYGDDCKAGTIRETFFANQLRVKYRLNIPKQGDFIVDDKFIFEVGGKNKGFEQIKDISSSYIAADEIEVGSGNKIPLWLFGLLY